MHACFHYQFHPVGQGLFASGALYESNTPDPKFLWVYDCGSVTFTEEPWWRRQIQLLKEFAHHRPTLDLLTLSHFDKDHINGVTALLGRFNVNMLLLPYAPLWQRLIVAFDGYQGDSDMMNYFIDPVAFLRQRGQIEHLVLIPPTQGDPPPLVETSLEPIKGPWTADAPFKRLDPQDPLVVGFGTKAQDLELLPAGMTINVQGRWEFLPYNKPLFRIPTRFPGFRVRVDQLRDDLLHGDAGGREAALDALKKEYDRTFGADGAARNRISLYLYGGPVYPTWKACKLLNEHGDDLPAYPRRQPCYYRARAEARGVDDTCSILYSGDGFLNSDASVRHLSASLGAERMRRLGVYQVNHHGARENWHAGLAAKLNPWLSVFSSDPGRGSTHHPHHEVWQDYARHQPTQVNSQGHGCGGWMLG